ncbi:MAG TPA: fructose-6-phosphate aldolase [Thermotogota bacterium]|nr:fructose-6-phosphate aldolase [Thermotogota bacterium]HPR95325.1 fructose-6-phosphate aldolase [Thermotogota bacterium]
MKFFLDTANLDMINAAKDYGLLDGVTTNPSLIAKEGIQDYHGHIRRICDITLGPVSAEVISEEYGAILSEARELAAISEFVVVKVPMTKNGIKAVRTLELEGIQTNVTLVFSPSQALLAAKAGASFISPFLGRIDDISWDCMEMLEKTLEIMNVYDFKSEIIAASIRSPKHVVEAAQMGCHIATIPFGVLEQMFLHPLTDKGIRKFLDDWNTLKNNPGKE